MRSSPIHVFIVVILSLGNLPRVIHAGPLKSSSKISPDAKFAAAEKYNEKDTEWIIDEINKPGVALPIKSSWTMLPVHNFFWFYCGAGQRRDANGRCRPIFSL